MRVFEFRTEELTTLGASVVVDLDAIVMFLVNDLNADHGIGGPMYVWTVLLTNGSIQLTKEGYDRAMAAWISN